VAPKLASVVSPLPAVAVANTPVGTQPEPGHTKTGHPELDRTELGQLAEAVRLLAEVSKAQSEAMLALARSTAESVQLAAGSYVFQLRDRFDEMLPAANVGASDTRWSVPDSPGPLEQLIFHPGDTACVDVRLAVSQTPIKRIVSVEWIELPDGCTVLSGPRFSGSGVRRADGRYQLDSDVSLFVDFTLSLNVGDRQPGPIADAARVKLECTDTRPEGAVGGVITEVQIRAVVVPDDDGVGLDVPTVDAVVLEERRTYWLDKAENLPLQLPRLH
jgi:hypothetical protein